MALCSTLLSIRFCFQALGLSRLGYKLLPEWPLPQQLLFALGMMDTKYRCVSEPNSNNLRAKFSGDSLNMAPPTHVSALSTLMYLLTSVSLRLLPGIT